MEGYSKVIDSKPLNHKLSKQLDKMKIFVIDSILLDPKQEIE